MIRELNSRMHRKKRTERERKPREGARKREQSENLKERESEFNKETMGGSAEREQREREERTMIM